MESSHSSLVVGLEDVVFDVVPVIPLIPSKVMKSGHDKLESSFAGHSDVEICVILVLEGSPLFGGKAL